MKILFWGTPAYAVPSLEALVAAGHQLVGVVTQPDRRRGRGSALVPSPVKERAMALGLSVVTPQRIRREPDLQDLLATWGADLSVVVAFGQILPPAVLAQPPLGCWNGHASLLPRWRGAAPIQWSLIDGDSQTGVGIMAMEAGLDTGPVLLERRLTIGLLENARQLTGRLSQLTAELLVEAMPLIERAGPGPEQERLRRLGVWHQPETTPHYARLLSKQDFEIDWSAQALPLHRRVMGLFPGAWCRWQGQRLKLLATEPLVARLGEQLSAPAAKLAQAWSVRAPGTPCSAHSGPAEPGTILEIVPELGLVVATGGCPLLICEAQLEGKSASKRQGLIQQLGASVGDRFGGGQPGPARQESHTD
ncbi:methionyl-tRNA formyltransferase [Synechococcus sp. CS-1325]|uniref:methionyl-tRNA formyltransferase n=1 Tax=Synechococcus sp. CS-1325 TaxID=2847979 RepID=UPI000DB43965|nr:methionyl-tRNA formyltransferase [Synechococcus sp. CS-1325]MCT0199694.1 methionyl-tRNA formyltransferase [Synechococcus sp. CS-1325]PZV01003.1 MAG: methionyl-tRNA formyltransferase [Cyanobium sp.]